MAVLKTAIFALWILALSSITLSEVLVQSEPVEGQAAVSETRLGVGFLFRILIFIVTGAIAGITAFVLWKRKIIFSFLAHKDTTETILLF